MGECLASIQAQQFEDWECVVVDDGSTDSTVEKVMVSIRGDPRFRLIRQEGSGVSVARNHGFYETSRNARFVTFMDADDCWESDALEILLEGANRSGSLVGAHGLAEVINEHGEIVDSGGFESFGRRRLGYRDGVICEWPLDAPTCFSTLCWTGPLYPPGVLMARRKVYEAVGLFDTTMRLCEDWDMAIRLSRYGDITFVNRVVVKYRRHSANASRDVAGNRLAVRRLHYKTFFSDQNRMEHKQLLREGWLAWQKFKLREKWNAALDGIRSGTPLAALRALLSTPVYLARYVKGTPGKGVI